MVQSEVYVYNFVTASTFLTSSNRNGKNLQILVSPSESKIDHTGSNTTSNCYADESVQSSLLSIYWQSYFSTSLESARLTLHTTAPKHSGCVCNVSKRSKKTPEWVKGLYLRVTKARYLGLTRQNQSWLYANYFGPLINTHKEVPQLFYTFFEDGLVLFYTLFEDGLVLFILFQAQARICTACSSSFLIAHLFGLLQNEWQDDPHGKKALHI